MKYLLMIFVFIGGSLFVNPAEACDREGPSYVLNYVDYDYHGYLIETTVSTDPCGNVVREEVMIGLFPQEQHPSGGGPGAGATRLGPG